MAYKDAKGVLGIRSASSTVERALGEWFRTWTLVTGRCDFRDCLFPVWTSGYPPVWNAELSLS